MKIVSRILVVLFFFAISTQITLAESEYVLPYPSFMPGTVVYKIRLITEPLQNIWHFGSFGQFSYNLKQSDRYLVEAKTLFEYKQYLLAVKALKKSNSYFEKVSPSLLNATKEGKDVSDKNIILENAKKKHLEVLQSLILTVPEEFVWTPEKVKSTKLNIWKEINNSIEIRS